ncbi:MAG: DNA-3-methyladenine glycosylase [Tissierellia bacterium]|nr:DNA-3-methyladenine glycosylase [Tissierellia bacterium]
MLAKDFYLRDTVEVARDLLGKVLVHQDGGRVFRGRILETEAYLGIGDRACHTFGGLRSPRTEPMWQEGGRAYIYLSYGLHHLFNVVTREAGVPEAVLIRAVALEDRALSSPLRFGKALEDLTPSQVKNLSNGPAKLTQAMAIVKDFTGQGLGGPRFYIEEGPREEAIITSTRIGIENSQEAASYPLRFYLEGTGVSKT